MRTLSVLAAAVWMVGTSIGSARATTFQLQDVTFSDGGTATGSFDIDVYGYFTNDSISIATTAGTALNGSVYDGGTLFNNPSPTSLIDFSSFASPDYTLVLDFVAPVGYGSSNFDALVPGGIIGGVLSGSYETCDNSGVCGSAYRLVETGTTYAPEPATLSLLGFSAAGLLALRRRRTSSWERAAKNGALHGGYILPPLFGIGALPLGAAAGGGADMSPDPNASPFWAAA